jgi:hypothetical protein
VQVKRKGMRSRMRRNITRNVEIEEDTDRESEDGERMEKCYMKNERRIGLWRWRK